MPKNSNKPASIYLFRVDPVTQEILEEKRVPTMLPGHVFVTDKMRRDYVVACRQCEEEGITAPLKWGGGDADGNNKTFIVPPDTRPKFIIDIQKTPDVARGRNRKRMKADGVDTVPIVMRKLNDRDRVDTTYNETIFINAGNDREIEFNFVNGVATKNYKSSAFGIVDIKSSNEHKIINPDFLVLAE